MQQNKKSPCYLGVEGGCHTCPSCLLREKGLNEYLAEKGLASV